MEEHQERKKMSSKSKINAKPSRADFDPGELGDTRYQWAVERWMMENHKLGAGYAASSAADLGNGRDDSRINPQGVEQKGTSMRLK